MPKQKGTALALMEIDGDEYSVRATSHAWSQMEVRRISVSTVVQVINLLGKERLKALQDRGLDVVVVYKALDVAVVFGWDGNKIMVVTVLNSSNVFAKRNTYMVEI